MKGGTWRQWILVMIFFDREIVRRISPSFVLLGSQLMMIMTHCRKICHKQQHKPNKNNRLGDGMGWTKGKICHNCVK